MSTRTAAILLCLVALGGCDSQAVTPQATITPLLPTVGSPLMVAATTATAIPPTLLPASPTVVPTGVPLPTATSDVILYTPVPAAARTYAPLVVNPPAVLPPTAAPPPATLIVGSSAALNPLEQQLFEQLNAARAAAGLAPVGIDPRLQAIAHSRSLDMVTRHYFGHVTPEGDSIRTILKAQGIAYTYSGEIIAQWRGADSVDQAMKWWLDDQIHRDVILQANYRYIGVGEAGADDLHTYTVDWLGPTLSSAD